MSKIEYFRVQATAKGLKLDSDASGLTYRKELIYANEPGEHFTKRTKDHYQEFTVDEDLIDHWAATGNRMRQNGVRIPTPLKHNDNPEANRGEIIRYETDINEDGRYALYGVVKFRDAKAAELAASTDVSIYVPEEPIYDSRNNKYEYAIRHVCFTDYPVIQGLSGFQAIAASLDRNELELSTGAKIGRNILSRAKSLGKKGADYVKKHKLLTAAGLYSTADFADTIAHGQKHKTLHADDSTLARTAKYAHNAATLGSAGVIGLHGVHDLNSARRMVQYSKYPEGMNTVAKTAAVLGGTALRGAIGAKSIAYAGHTGHEVLHRSALPKKRKHKTAELSLSDTEKKRRSTLSRVANGTLGALNIAGAAESTRQIAKALAQIALKRKLGIPFTKQELATLAATTGLNALIGVWSGVEGVKGIRKAFEASLILSDEEVKRGSNGRFAPVPGSKWSQRMQRSKDRAAERQIKEISGYRPGSSGKAATPPSTIPTKTSVLESAARNVHDFYTADAAELGRGHNLLHAGKHALLALPTAGAAYGVGKIAANNAKHALRWRKLDETAVKAIGKAVKSITGPKTAVSAVGKITPHVEKMLKGRGPAITKLVVAGTGLAAAVGATTAQLRAAQLHANEAFKRKK